MRLWSVLLSFAALAAGSAHAHPHPSFAESPTVSIFRAGKVRLGVHISPLSADERAELGLGEDLGLRVDRVIDDSPADRAGFEEGDVILEVGDEEMRSTEQLVDAVRSHAGDTTRVLVLRRGKRLELSPEIASGDVSLAFEGHDPESVRELYEHLLPQHGGSVEEHFERSESYAEREEARAEELRQRALELDRRMHELEAQMQEQLLEIEERILEGLDGLEQRILKELESRQKGNEL
jgi:hypothetical protein